MRRTIYVVQPWTGNSRPFAEQLSCGRSGRRRNRRSTCPVKHNLRIVVKIEKESNCLKVSKELERKEPRKIKSEMNKRQKHAKEMLKETDMETQRI